MYAELAEDLGGKESDFGQFSLSALLGGGYTFPMVFGVASSSPLQLSLEGVLHTRPINCNCFSALLF